MRRTSLPFKTARPSPRPILGSVLLAALLLASVWFGAAPAEAAKLPSPRSEWIELRTANFRVVSSAGERKTADVALALERFRQVLGLLSPDLELEAPIPTTILAFDNDRGFRPYKRRFPGAGEELAGYFVSYPLGNFIALNAYPQRADALPVVYHEYTHFFLRHNLPFLPLWANEGLAEYYSTFEEQGSDVLIGRPVRHHAQLLQTRSMLPLERLFEIDTESPEYGGERESKTIFYAQSWALMHYLLTSGEETRAAAGDLLARLSAGEDAAEAVRATLGLSLGQLENRLLGEVRKGRFSFFKVGVGELAAPAEYTVRELPRAEVLTHLGDLLAIHGESAAGDALAHYREALRLDGTYPEAYHGLGLLAWREGRLEDAEAQLARAVELGSQEARTYALAAQVILDGLQGEGPRLVTLPPPEETLGEGGRPAASGAGSGRGTEETETGAEPPWLRARSLVEKGRRLDPSFAELDVLQGSTYFYDPEGAGRGIPYLARALSRLPDRPDVAFNLVMLYVKAGELEGARRVVDRTLVPSGREDLVREAEEAIELNRYLLAANEASREGRLGEAAELLREALARTADPGLMLSLEDEIRRMEAMAAVNESIESYNEAVKLANAGEVSRALRALKRLLPRVNDPGLERATRELIAELERAQ